MPIHAPYHSSMEKEVAKAASIINSFFNSTLDADSAIPADMIRGCCGLAFLTVIKAGMIWTGKLGTGVVIARLEDGSWSPPSGIGTAGVGFGAEIGGEIIDFMIVLGSQKAVATFKKGTQVSVGAGLDLTAGPVGRTASANVNAGGGGLSGNYTYAHSKGLFAGIGLHGSTIMVRGDMNSKFYGREVTPMEILSGHIQPPAGACDLLYEAIRRVEAQGDVSSASLSYPTYGSYRHSSSGVHNSPSATATPSRGSLSSSNSISSAGRSSFEGQRSSFASKPTTVTPDPDDPRLRRYSTYKSERELYAQFERQKSGLSSSASTSSISSAGSFASTGSVAYAAAQAYTAASAPPPVPQSSTHTHPTNPSLKYTSYPAPPPNPHYTPPANASYPSYTAPPPVSRESVPPIPPAAVGAETKQVYMQVINFVSTRCPHANVQIFKDNCRLFGQDAMSLDAYFSYLSSICTKQLLKELIPQLVRLLPTQEKRERLWTLYVREVLYIKI